MCTRMMCSGAALVAAVMLSAVWSASDANAYEIRLETASSTTVRVGDVVTFDAYLDTQGESDISVIAIDLGFDDSIFTFRTDLSQTQDEVLYSPSMGKGDPVHYLGPLPGWGSPAVWTGDPPNRAELQLLSSSFGNLDVSKRGTVATATNAYIGTFGFEAVAPGTNDFDWSLEYASTIFALSDGIDIKDQVSTPGGGTWTVVVPEPATALLVGLGLLGLALMRPTR